MKKLSLLAIFIIIALSLMACGSQKAPKTEGTENDATAESSSDGKAEEKKEDAEASEEDVELVLWHTLTEHHKEALEKIISDFNDSQDHITVVAQEQPYQDFDSKLMQAVRNGTGPDLVRTFPSNVVNYLDEDMIVDFAPYINDAEIGMENFEDNIPEGIYQEITQWGDDSVYLFPIHVTGQVFFYNKTLYDELGLKAPATWTELEENSRAIKEKTGNAAFGADSVTDLFTDLVMQGGSDYINPESKTVEFNNEIGLEKLEWFTGNVKEGNFRLVGEDQYFSNPFGSQAVASYIGSSAGADFVASAVADQFEFDVAPIPQEGPEEFFPSWLNGYVAFKSDEAKEKATYEFLRFHAAPEQMTEWTMAYGAVPVFQDAVNSPDYQAYIDSNIAIQALIPQMEIIGYLPSVKGASSVLTHIDEMVQSAALETKTPEKALEDAASASNADLQ
ncbi:hypothetical protein CWR48_12235 [Oceanobacillus arenosus]|uniref:ABC transporter substrate-binding protein n=1 Tax=Oceanobacillus arenosus TaxID=1229153 RepID=A0A3D8PRK6_9BACI|nr:extracellular solute-binding protein [Oceanobacillus arenosus]RDW18342.1 hypothetical protein CWR48_12235 [Oceanobacillus arenosus]